MKLKPLYTVTELAAMAGMHRNSMRKLVFRVGITPVRSGRRLLIPLSEVMEKLEPVLTSYKFAKAIGKQDE